MPKHFNKAHVWGPIDGVPTTKRSNEGKGAPYLRLMLNCYDPQFGNVQAYGKIFGQKNIDEVMLAFKQNPRQKFKFTGFFGQYDDAEGTRRSNFTFIKYELIESANPRAAFILVGEVKSIEADRISLHLERPMKVKKEGDTPKIQVEDFDLFFLDPAKGRGILPGETVQVAGRLRSRGGEDDYGRSSSIRPYVEEIEPRDKKEVGTPF